VVIAMVLACLVAPALRTLDQAYQFIQEYVGFYIAWHTRDLPDGLLLETNHFSRCMTAALLTIPLSTMLKIPSGMDTRIFS